MDLQERGLCETHKTGPSESRSEPEEISRFIYYSLRTRNIKRGLLKSEFPLNLLVNGAPEPFSIYFIITVRVQNHLCKSVTRCDFRMTSLSFVSAAVIA